MIKKVCYFHGWNVLEGDLAMSSTKYILAENLKRAMANSAKCSTQPLLAKRAGVGQTTVGRILRCEADTTTEFLFKLAKALNIQPHTLLIDPKRETSANQPLDFDGILDVLVNETQTWSKKEFDLLIGSVEALKRVGRKASNRSP